MQWTRMELTAVREALEVTPNFEGRPVARDLLREAVRAPRLGAIAFELEIAHRLAQRIVPIDTATATARAKLAIAVRKASEQAA